LLSFEAAAAKLRKKNVPIQLKIDTGMNRLGILPDDMDCFARQLAKCPHLLLGGVFTHFASSEVLCDLRPGPQTRQQMERFYAAIDRLRAMRIDRAFFTWRIAPHRSIAGKLGDMVRPGALLYGIIRDSILRSCAQNLKRLAVAPGDEPAHASDQFAFDCRGDGVGYNASWVAQRPSRIAILAAGYGDGSIAPWGILGA